MIKLLPFLLLFVLFGCNKLNKLTEFEIEYDSTIIIPSSTGINLPTNIFTPDISSNSESKFEINDTRKDLIEKILLQELTLTVTSPSSGNFNFLKTIRIFLDADGLDEIKVAWKENMGNSDAKTISLEIACIDLQEYIKKDNFNLRVETVTDEFLSPDHEIALHSVYFVDAKLLKNK